MQRLVYIKTHSSPHVAHLYEHLYISAVSNLFLRHNLFALGDYYLAGRTYMGGFIHIDILLITPEAMALGKVLKDVRPTLDDESIAGGLLELMAEEQGRARCDFKTVQKSVKELHKKPWQTFEEFMTFNTLKTRRTYTELSFSHKKPKHFRTIFTEFLLSKSFAEATPSAKPLFWIVASVLTNNMIHDIVSQHSYYPYSLNMLNDKGTLKSSRRYRGLRKAATEPSNTLLICKQSLENMLAKNIIEKIIRHANEDFNRLPMGAPDELDIYESTKVLVGKAGWRQISTAENVKEVIQHTTLQVKCGSETQSFKLSNFP